MIKKLLINLKLIGFKLTVVKLVFKIFNYLSFNHYKRKKFEKNLFKIKSVEERFDKIYSTNYLLDDESRSGTGSTLKSTEDIREHLPNIIEKLNIKKLFDAPCGDFNWMRFVLPKVNVEYCGFDIVESIIRKNKEAYSDKNIDFEVANICTDKLPKCDLLMVRDCLFHLSNEDINKFLDNIKKVDYKYLLTTSHILDEDFVNKDIVSGDFRLINLFIEPFNFKHEAVIEFVDDSPKEHNIPRHMIFIAKDDVPNGINYSN